MIGQAIFRAIRRVLPHVTLLRRLPASTPMKAASSHLFKTWTRQPIPIDFALRDNLTVVRARARDVALNTEVDARFDNLVRANVVGPEGMRLQVRLRKGDAQDKATNDAIELAWRRWGRVADASGRWSWTTLQHLAISTVRKDGEVFVRKFFTPDGLRVQLVDPELVDATYFEDLRNGNKVRFGIEFDEATRPVAYHFTIEQATWLGYAPATTSARVRVPAEQVLHFYLPRHVGQKRGIPWAANTLVRMHNLEGYEDAAVVNARVGANKIGFLAPADEGRGLPGMFQGTKAGDGAVEIRSGPGEFPKLPPNTKLEKWDPAYPHEQYDPFIRAQLRAIASGLGVSYPVLANDYAAVTFSSIRAAVLEDRDFWRLLQLFTLEHLHMPLFHEWLVAEIGSQRLRDGAGRPIGASRLEEVFEAARWAPRGWAWVDPLKEAKAATESIANRTATRSQFIREQGRDPSETFVEAAEEEEELRELGVSTSLPGNAAAPAEDDDKPGGEEEARDAGHRFGNRAAVGP